MIILAAIGIRRSVGGIAAASRNLELALRELATANGLEFVAHVLGEGPTPDDESAGYFVHDHSKTGFTLALLRELARAELVVFDHVRLALPLLALPRLLRPKVVICAHGSESWKRIRASSRRLFRAADLVITNSTFTLTKMRQTFDGFRGEVCELGLPPQHEISPSPVLPPGPLDAADGVARPIGPRMMLLVARMDAAEREKGHRELIAAMPQIVEQVPQAQLVFVGGGSDTDELRAIATASTASARIFLPGQVPDALLRGLYASSYAYVMPSRQEGFGLVYLEAMSYGKPCVACHGDGGADVVLDGESGILIKQPVEIDALARALIGLLDDPERATRYGAAGQRRLLERFTAEAHRTRIKKLLAPLLVPSAALEVAD